MGTCSVCLLLGARAWPLGDAEHDHVLGVFPGGFALFAAINAITGGDSDRATLPSLWQLLAVVLATVLVVAALTAVPARLGGRRPVDRDAPSRTRMMPGTTGAERSTNQLIGRRTDDLREGLVNAAAEAPPGGW
jgi:hypothetical protein